MQQRHKDRKLYFDEQAATTEKYVIPYIAKYKSIGSDTSVLEIGCGEGGNLKPFVDFGCQCVATEAMVNALLEIKETGITLERFERICRDEHYRILDNTSFFINPNYEVKFRLKPRRCLPVFRAIPYLRDLYVTAGYYLIDKNDKI